MARGFPITSVDQHTDCAYVDDRNGMFDFFLGKPDMSWTETLAWERDFVGVSNIH